MIFCQHLLPTVSLTFLPADHLLLVGSSPGRLCSAQLSRSGPEDVEPANSETTDDQRLREVSQHPGSPDATKQTKTNIFDETSNFHENETETETENSVP